MVIQITQGGHVAASGLYRSKDGELIRLSAGEKAPPQGSHWRMIALPAPKEAI